MLLTLSYRVILIFVAHTPKLERQFGTPSRVNLVAGWDDLEYGESTRTNAKPPSLSMNVNTMPRLGRRGLSNLGPKASPKLDAIPGVLRPTVYSVLRSKSRVVDNSRQD